MHWKALQRVLRYLKGTINYGLVYNIPHNADQHNAKLEVYCDSDWAGDVNDRKSTTGYVILMNSTAISWKSTKQSGISTSTVGAEYYALAMTIMEVIWI